MNTPPRDSRSPVTLKIKFKSESLDQFIERYSVDVSRGGIFIRTKEPLAVGTPLKFEFQLQDGSSLIGGEGTVVWIREYDPSRSGVAPGMGVRFDKLSGASGPVLDKILAEKARREQGGGQPAPARSAAAPAPARAAAAPAPARAAAAPAPTKAAAAPAPPVSRRINPSPAAPEPAAAARAQPRVSVPLMPAKPRPPVPPPGAVGSHAPPAASMATQPPRLPGAPPPPPPPTADSADAGDFDGFSDEGATRVAAPSFDFAAIQRELKGRKAQANGAKPPLSGLSSSGAKNLAAVTLTGFMRDGKLMTSDPRSSSARELDLDQGDAAQPASAPSMNDDVPDLMAGPAPEDAAPAEAAFADTGPSAAPPSKSKQNIDSLFEDEQMPTPMATAAPLQVDDIAESATRLSAQRAAVAAPIVAGSARAPERRTSGAFPSLERRPSGAFPALDHRSSGSFKAMSEGAMPTSVPPQAFGAPLPFQSFTAARKPRPILLYVLVAVAALVAVAGGVYYFVFAGSMSPRADRAAPPPAHAAPRDQAPTALGKLPASPVPVPVPGVVPAPASPAPGVVAAQPSPPAATAAPASAPPAPPPPAAAIVPEPHPAPAPAPARPVRAPLGKAAAARMAAAAAKPAAAPAAPGSGYALHVNSTPKGAEVLIDGQVVGKTPYIGRDFDHTSAHALTVRAPGYEPHEQMVSGSDNWVRRAKETSLLVFTKLQKSAGGAAPPAAEPAAAPDEPKKDEPKPAEGKLPAAKEP